MRPPQGGTLGAVPAPDACQRDSPDDIRKKAILLCCEIWHAADTICKAVLEKAEEEAREMERTPLAAFALDEELLDEVLLFERAVADAEEEEEDTMALQRMVEAEEGHLKLQKEDLARLVEGHDGEKDFHQGAIKMLPKIMVGSCIYSCSDSSGVSLLSLEEGGNSTLDWESRWEAMGHWQRAVQEENEKDDEHRPAEHADQMMEMERRETEERIEGYQSQMETEVGN